MNLPIEVIEQIWKEIRKRGSHDEVFAALEKVVDRLSNTICSLDNEISLNSWDGLDKVRVINENPLPCWPERPTVEGILTL